MKIHTKNVSDPKTCHECSKAIGRHVIEMAICKVALCDFCFHKLEESLERYRDEFWD